MPTNMHSKTRLTTGSFNLKKLSAAVASALLFSNAYAAGLGKLTVLSALGQPLRAEIELTSVSKDEIGALTAKLASSETFRQANIDFNPALTSLRFSIEQRGSKQFIRMTSAQPLNEPFVDLLLELSGPNGRLVREYTFLLDPADLRTTQSAQVAPAPVAGSNTSRPQQAIRSETRSYAQNPPQEAAPRPSRPPVSQPVEAAGNEQGGEYQVRRGDTLSKIAGQVKPNGVSLDQMLVALYQANPDAFAGENMNRLKSGQILSVPGADVARSISTTEARNVVVAQAADFNQYRSRLAGQVAGATPQKSLEAKQSAGGKITAKVEEQSSPASESKDKLTLSNAAAAQGSSADKAAGGTASAEDRIAKEKAIAEANARVKELERNVTELQKLLEVKNKSLAEQQQQADATKAESPATPSAAEPASSPTQVASAPAEAAPAAEPTEVKAEQAATPPAPPAAANPPAPAAKTAPVTPPAPEPGFVDSLTDNPLLLPGLGALLVALGGLGIYRARRQKQSKQFEDSIITDSSLKANSLFGSTGGQSVDTNNSVFNSSFSPSASQLDTNEVDPVAEADVYIAYGRDAQAEEILKEALRTQPDRNAVRVKLLEIYSNRKDLRAFEVMATELYGLTKGEGDEWAQAAALGVAIDPNNPLYASGKKDQGEPSNLVAPTQPLDEQGLVTLLSTTQTDVPSNDAVELEADTSYFSNTALADEKPLEPLPPLEPASELEVAPEATATKESNEIDFDLDGMQDIAVPNTIPRPASAEPPAELASIDFNFLDEPQVQSGPAEEPVAEAMPESLDDNESGSEAKSEQEAEAQPVSSIPDLGFALDDITAEEKPAVEPAAQNISADIPPLDFNIPGLDNAEPSAVEPKAKEESSPLDFDLSDISLELPPSQPEGKLDLASVVDNEFGLEDVSGASSAEMATKLDLAIAYQEIGDKEGARELLDEVMKGGTPEQSEKAKSLLLELA